MRQQDDQQQIRQQERERALQEQNAPETDVRVTRPSVVLPDYPPDKKPCFTIHAITLDGEDASRFQWALESVKSAQGRCLGGEGIRLVINRVQNAILQQGYVTTRVVSLQQSVADGVIRLTLFPGRIDQIRFIDKPGFRARLWNAVPARSGDILNLRDVEQALENFKRVPSAEADIQIAPGEQEGSSDLLVAWKERRPVRLNLGLDDSGMNSTGKYIGSVTLSVDAPFAQNDLFYANLGQGVLQDGPFASRSRTVNYSIPFGYWQLSANYNDYRYHQNIPNANEVVTYSGKSENASMTLSRLLFRNQNHKTTLNMQVWRRHSSNAVNDIKMKQQERRTAGWELGLGQRSFFGSVTVDGNLNWRRGTGAFGALRAQEEAYNGGTGRPSILTADLGVDVPFRLGAQPLRYNTSWRGQWSNVPLTPQDRVAIGGRYSVRGFDGEQSLSGDKGLIWRNELAWNIAGRGQETYLALDYGRVAGPGARYLKGQQLAGAAIGVRGSVLNTFRYDLFAGVPVNKPSGFETKGCAAGFSISIQI
ncbi:MAG: ShlB/FhaC/HecB family hemolysin secretion/activation protein [Enterobacteriaceae bacterium]